MAYNLTTPRTLAQRVIRAMSKGDESRDFPFGEREVIAMVIDVSNALAKSNYYDFRGDELTKSVDAHYVQTYNGIDVKINNVTGQNYIDLPAPYLSLPSNAGVQRIAPFTDKAAINKAMIPVQPNELDVLGDILGSMQKQWVYELQGTKAFFHKRCGKTLCESDIVKVSATLVVSIPDLAPDTPFPMPPEMHADVISAVVERLSLMPKKDQINDNNPNTMTSNE